MAKRMEKHSKRARKKLYFYTINQRLNIYIILTIELTNILTGYGKLKAYYHRFKIIEQLWERRPKRALLLYDCKLYNMDRTQVKDKDWT